jgi:hypothetical protein
MALVIANLLMAKIFLDVTYDWAVELTAVAANRNNIAVAADAHRQERNIVGRDPM